MGSSAVRHVALGVLMVGVAAIAWTVLGGGDDAGDGRGVRAASGSVASVQRVRAQPTHGGQEYVYSK